MALELVDNLEVKNSDVSENEKLREKKDRNRPPTKIVIRRLPPSMTEETFREEVSPLPDNDYLYFVRADLSLGPAAFSRAYINFIKQEDIFLFKDQYDGYIFVDKTGGEYPAVVEFAPFQRLPKKRAARRKDVKVGTIEDDPTYLAFLQSIEDEIKDKENEHTFDYSYKPAEVEDKKVTTTPLLEFLKQRRAERQRSRDERKEDRRKKERERELEKRKIREDERKKKRTDFKDRDKETSVKQVLRSVSSEKDGAISKAAKDKDGKYMSEKKREDEKPAYKDKYQDSKARESKPAFKPGQTVRQKPVDSRGQRNEVRKSAEDLRKKPQTRAADSQDHYGNSRRGNAAGGDSRKPVTKTRDKEPAAGTSRNKDREPRKTGRDYDTKKSFKEEPKKAVDKDKQEKEVRGETSIVDAVNEVPADSVSNTEKRTIERRFSLEGDYAAVSEIPDNLTAPKPFRNSADNLSKRKGKTFVPKLTVDKPQAAPTSSRKNTKDTFREPQRRPERKPRKDEASTAQRKTSREAKEIDKLRRSSLESGNAASEVASKVGAAMRRNHSLELETDACEGDRSRETSVVSSNDGEDKRANGDGTKRDQRPERRIRNKDRPSIEIYRPGMGRFSKQRIDKDKE